MADMKEKREAPQGAIYNSTVSIIRRLDGIEDGLRQNLAAIYGSSLVVDEEDQTIEERRKNASENGIVGSFLEIDRLLSGVEKLLDMTSKAIGG